MLRKLLSKQKVKPSARLDRSFKNYVAVMDSFVAEAETPQERDYLRFKSKLAKVAMHFAS